MLLSRYEVFILIVLWTIEEDEPKVKVDLANMVSMITYLKLLNSITQHRLFILWLIYFVRVRDVPYSAGVFCRGVKRLFDNGFDVRSLASLSNVCKLIFFPTRSLSDEDGILKSELGFTHPIIMLLSFLKSALCSGLVKQFTIIISVG